MKKWIVKSAVQRVISYLPHSHEWNGLLQKYVTKGLELRQSTFASKLDCCQKHLDHYFACSPKPKERFAVLEVGTGWWPILPLGLYLSGAEEIWTLDIAPLLRFSSLKRVMELYSEFDQDGRLGKILTGVRPERMSRLRECLAGADSASAVALLETLNIRALIGDAQQTGLPSGSMDLVYSNFVLEHIPLEVQARWYAEFKRISSRNAVMSHYVGIADQYANFDRSITPFNFLQYPAQRWKWFNNSIIPQTRLRASDYRGAIERSGYKILREHKISGSAEDLQKITLAPEFRKYSEEDLLVLYYWVAATPG